MAAENLTPDEEFVNALKRDSALYGAPLGAETTRGLLEYFRLFRRWGQRLHLAAPCTPEEFATRHVLESLSALAHVPASATLVDVGSGGGLPAIPCLVARPDLGATLVEASHRKAVFLREALSAVGAGGRAEVLAERFEKLPPPRADVLTCRALERFKETLPALFAWSANVPTLLLFGGPSLAGALDSLGAAYTSDLLPQSERRYLFVVRRRM